MAFTNKVIDGGDIVLKVGTKVLGCATTHSVEITNDTREISCKGSGVWKSSEYSRFSWTVSVDALLNLYEGDSATTIRFSEFMNLYLNKTLITVSSFYSEGADEFEMYGQAVITSVSQNNPDADNAGFSISLQGRGELGISNTNLWEITVNATGADFVVVEETGLVYPYTAGMTIKAVDGTYNILAYETATLTRDRDTATVSGANTSVTLTLA